MDTRIKPDDIISYRGGSGPRYRVMLMRPDGRPLVKPQAGGKLMVINRPEHFEVVSRGGPGAKARWLVAEEGL